jgi:DNA-binding NarL/FixJ family response regulator
MTIRVAIADDHPLVRSGLARELEQHSGLHLVDQATNGDDALKMCLTHQPDVLVLDIGMPGMKTIPLLRELNTALPSLRIIILTAHSDVEYIISTLQAGAHGFILKEEDPSLIIEGIRTVMRGSIWLSREVNRIYRSQVDDASAVTFNVLSDREIEVLTAVAEGKPNTRIADELALSEGTVKNYVSTIYDKLQVNSRSEAIVWAWRHGLVE